MSKKEDIIVIKSNFQDYDGSVPPLIVQSPSKDSLVNIVVIFLVFNLFNCTPSTNPKT